MVGDLLVVGMPYARDKGRMAVLLGPIDRLFLCLEVAEHMVGGILNHKVSNGGFPRNGLWDASTYTFGIPRPYKQRILSDIQYHRLPTGNLDRISPPTGQDGAGERRDVRHRSARWISLVLSHNAKCLLTSILPAHRDGHAERNYTAVGRRPDNFRTCSSRTPITDFPQRGGGSLRIAFVDRSPIRRFKTVDRGFNRREPIFRYEIAVGRCRPIGKFFGAGVRFFHKDAAHSANAGALSFALP